jgi:hypothetical protein
VRIFFGLDDSNKPAPRCIGLKLKKGERGEKETLLIDSLDNLAGFYSLQLRHLAVPRDPKREMFGPVSS